MKKIIHVVYNMDCGGIEKFIMTMYSHMKEMDVTFDFIYMNDSNTKSYFDEQIKKMGGNIYYTGKLNKKTLFTFIKNFKKIIKNNGPYDALHVHSFYNCGFISLIAKLCGQKNIVTHSHTTIDNKQKNSFVRKMYRFVAKKLILMFSDYRLACGEEAGKILYGKKSFKVINNGIMVENFLNVKQNEIQIEKQNLKIKDELVVIHVGSFNYVKNHEYILKIAHQLLINMEKVKILLLGDGPLKNEIEEKVKKENLTEIISFLGLKKDVEKYLLLSDVFILPSRYEGFPISAVEAQTAGLPCIVSKNIDKNIDLKINKFSFVDINDENINEWCSLIKNCSKKTKLNDSINIIKSKSMDSLSSAKELYKVYIGDKYEKDEN